MRTSLRGISGLAVAGLFSLTTLTAARAAVEERELLGVRIFRPFTEVLAKHGQPTRIEIGAVTSPTSGPAQGGTSAMGGGAGTLPPMAGMGAGRAGGAAGMGSMYNQMGRQPGMGRAGGGGGMAAGGGDGMMMTPNLAGKGSLMGGGGMMGGQMAQSRAFSMRNSGMGTGGMMGGGAMGGGGGMAGGFGGGGQQSSGDEGEVTWIYEKGPLTYMFLFNKDGRVIQISEFGYAGGVPTKAGGVRLGDSVSRVYSKYGWSGAVTKLNNQLTLDYSDASHVAFQMLDQGKSTKVVGITVAYTEKTNIMMSNQGMGGMGMYGGQMMGGPMGGMGRGPLPGFGGGGLPGAGGKGGAGGAAEN